MVRKKKMRDPDLVLCVLLTDSPVERFKITDIHNFSTSSVEDIKFRASQKTGLGADELDLMYRGCILQGDKKLSDCDFKKGATIFVTKKKRPVSVPAKTPVSDSIIKFVSKAFRRRSMLPLYWSYVEKMKEGAGMEILISKHPGLISDPVALAILQDSDLFESLGDLTTAERAAELHPVLIETVHQVIKEIIPEEKRSGNSEPAALPSLNLDFALPDTSDVQDMDSSQSPDAVPGSSSQSQVNVADAALLATLGEMPEPYQVEALSSAAHSSSSTPPVLITPEMVSQAMQSAMASVAPLAASSLAMPSQSGDASNLGIQLQQMQELGLLDIAANMQALTATGGDVQAAINLLLSGGVTSDEDN